MTPLVNAITIKRGTTWRWTGTIRDDTGVPVNLTGWSVASKLRAPSGTLLATFACTVDVDQGANPGKLQIYASAAATSTWPLGSALWDVAVTDAGGDVDISRTVNVRVEEAVTR